MPDRVLACLALAVILFGNACATWAAMRSSPSTFRKAALVTMMSVLGLGFAIVVYSAMPADRFTSFEAATYYGSQQLLFWSSVSIFTFLAIAAFAITYTSKSRVARILHFSNSVSMIVTGAICSYWIAPTDLTAGLLAIVELLVVIAIMVVLATAWGYRRARRSGNGMMNRRKYF